MISVNYQTVKAKRSEFLGNSNGFFKIDSVLGIISTTRQLSLSSPEHMLLVKAEDNGSPRLSNTVSVRVVVIMSPLSAPRFRKEHYKIEVPECTLPGTLLLSVFADSSSTILYRFRNSSQGFERYLRLSPNTGSVLLDEALK